MVVPFGTAPTSPRGEKTSVANLSNIPRTFGNFETFAERNFARAKAVEEIRAADTRARIEARLFADIQFRLSVLTWLSSSSSRRVSRWASGGPRMPCTRSPISRCSPRARRSRFSMLSLPHRSVQHSWTFFFSSFFLLVSSVKRGERVPCTYNGSENIQTLKQRIMKENTFYVNYFYRKAARIFIALLFIVFTGEKLF